MFHFDRSVLDFRKVIVTASKKKDVIHESSPQNRSLEKKKSIVHQSLNAQKIGTAAKNRITPENLNVP